MVDWLDVRKDPIEAIEHGVNETRDLWAADPWTGPRNFGRIDYPAVEVLPDETSRLDATNWEHTIVVNCYFERTRELDYVDDVLQRIAAVLDECLLSLSNTACTNNYYPEAIQDFAGELDNTSVLLVSIRFRVTTLVDPGEFDD